MALRSRCRLGSFRLPFQCSIEFPNNSTLSFYRIKEYTIDYADRSG